MNIRRLVAMITIATLQVGTAPAAAKSVKLEQLSLMQRVTFAIASVYFYNKPMLVKVAFCESSFDQTKYGKIDHDDTGLMQINARIHKKEIARLGIDITNIFGNMAFAGHLEAHQGLNPWLPSRPCWKNLQLPKVSPPTKPARPIS